MRENLPLQPWRVCLIRHVAAKVRFYRGDETYSTCLHCPQITDALGVTAADIKSEVTEMAKTGRHNSRVTCKTCKQPDSFNFSNGNCRKCHFGIKEGRIPYPFNSETAPAENLAQPPAEENLGAAGVVALETKPCQPASEPKVNRSAPLAFVTAFLEEKQIELERLENAADFQASQLETMRQKIRILRNFVDGLEVAIDYDKTGVSL